MRNIPLSYYIRLSSRKQYLAVANMAAKTKSAIDINVNSKDMGHDFAKHQFIGGINHGKLITCCTNCGLFADIFKEEKYHISCEEYQKKITKRT
jgi:hypothetical protein